MADADLIVILPEILLSVYAMLALIVAVYAGKDRLAPALTWTTAVAMAGLGLWIAFTRTGTTSAFHGMFVDDPFARFGKTGVLLGGAAVLMMSEKYLSRLGQLRFELPVLFALGTVGMMVMVSAADLIVLYMGLELLSLSLYVVAAFRRDSVKSNEAGLKYFVLGALSSGLLLYGASLTYGYAGTTLLSGVIAATEAGASIGLLFGLVFLITGLAFKVSAVPFHMWTPDVYEGAPTPVTAYFATAPKLAAMLLFGRVMFDAFGTVTADWTQVVALISALSMFLGAIAGISQTNFKRLMAYSSISHMGFALMGLAAGTELGVQAMLVYMAIYVTMNIGVFAFILSMSRDGQPVAELSSLNQYASREPLKALALMVLLFSLAGVPPLVGFFGKWWVLKAAIDAGWFWLALGGVIASVIGAFYYLRIVFYMYFGKETDPLDAGMSSGPWVMLMGTAVIMVVGVINLFGVEGFAGTAAAALVR